MIGTRTQIDNRHMENYAGKSVSKSIQFGLFGGPVAPPGGPTEREAYEDYVRYVIDAERYGFAGVFLTEHHFTGFGQASAPINLLTYLAGCTSSIRLGTAVTVLPWFNPVALAEQAATLDLLSGGRLDFGVGRGFRQSEFDGFQIRMDEASSRFEECLDLVQRAWSEDERWSYQGERWSYADVVCEPQPIQRPHPPIWMGAGSEEGIRAAARRGFNLLLDQIAGFDVIGERVSIYRDEQARLGVEPKPHDIAVCRALMMAETDEERAAAISERGMLMQVVATLANGRGGPSNRMARDYSTNMNEASENGALIGDRDEIVERLAALRAVGVDYVLLIESKNSRDRLGQFAEDVMPRVSDLRSPA